MVATSHSRRPPLNWRRAFLLFAGLLWLAFQQSALAHPEPQSNVKLSVRNGAWYMELVLPEERLQAALVQANLIVDPNLNPADGGEPAFTPEEAKPYILDHIQAQTASGALLSPEVREIVPPSSGNTDWNITLILASPEGASTDSIRLKYDVLIREIATHQAVIAVSGDWARGQVLGSARIVSVLHGTHTEVEIGRDTGSAWQSFGRMLLFGSEHILSGPDHLAFLLMLMLTAPLMAVGKRWSPVSGTVPGYSNILFRVTAFTLGHTTSLIAVYCGALPAGGRLVEILIAISVGITALHAIRPIFPRREAWVAGGFGLIHGMAFASSIAALSLSRGETLLAMFAFNLGIELVQLVLVIALTPLLITWRNAAAMKYVRLFLASAGALAALVWIILRVL